MQLQQLKYILEIERTGSMNKAASSLFVSQPNLSSAIRNLEEELGIKIFDRTSRGVKVTQEGKLLIQYAKTIVGQVEQLKQAYGIEERKHVSFLEISQTGMVHLAPAIRNIYNTIKDSRVEIVIKEDNLGEVIKNLYYMKSEVAVVVMNTNQLKLVEKVMDKRKMEMQIFGKNKLGIVVSPTSSLYAKDEVEFLELGELTYIECLEEKNISLNNDPDFGDVWSRFLGNVIHVTDADMVTDLLWHIDSYSFDIENNIAYLNKRGLKFIKLKEDIDMYLGWIKRRREPLSYEANLFVEELIKSAL